MTKMTVTVEKLMTLIMPPVICMIPSHQMLAKATLKKGKQA